jgi:PhoH-like ATPase
VDFITLLGQAGTGKTLLALAAGLEQVLDSKR